jgi:altronate hydrolase
MKEKSIQIHPMDTVAVALEDLQYATEITIDGRIVTLQEDIPRGHKFSLTDIPSGESIIKYGFPIGYAAQHIRCGTHVHIHNTRTRLESEPSYGYNPENADNLLEKTVPRFIQAYERENGAIGIRNELWIIPTVGCVNKIAASLANWGASQVANGTFPGIEGVHAWEHPYGCSQLGEDHERTRRILADLAHHPHAAGVLVIGLGCENNTVDSFKMELGEFDSNRVKFLVTQQVSDEITKGKQLLESLATFGARAVRTSQPLSKLVVGLKCGGSDGLSGITANPLVGRFSDYLIAQGGTALLTEIPEMFGAEDLLMNRCGSQEIFEKLVAVIQGFKQYFIDHNQVVYENPSPGNKDGGITTLEDKSLGCVQKGGTSPITGVLSYGDRVKKTGLHVLEGPGNDIVSTTAMTAAGAHIILFTTGRGTPLGSPVPTIKISTNSNLAKEKSGWIDLDAGRLLTDGFTPILNELVELVADVASGKVMTKNELNDYREIAIFKDGVTL